MTKADHLGDYLDAIARIRNLNAGTPETSFYPALANLFDAIGAGLTPPVFCLSHVSGKEAGIPDFGFFERRKTQQGETPAWTAGIAPERGVAEIKGIGHNIAALVAGAQIQNQYLPAFGLVLATNLWRFRLVSAEGVIDAFDLADSEAGFLALVHGPRPRALSLKTFHNGTDRAYRARNREPPRPKPDRPCLSGDKASELPPNCGPIRSPRPRGDAIDQPIRGKQPRLSIGQPSPTVPGRLPGGPRSTKMSTMSTP
jgi:hypothetical protein